MKSSPCGAGGARLPEREVTADTLQDGMGAGGGRAHLVGTFPRSHLGIVQRGGRASLGVMRRGPASVKPPRFSARTAHLSARGRVCCVAAGVSEVNHGGHTLYRQVNPTNLRRLNL